MNWFSGDGSTARDNPSCLNTPLCVTARSHVYRKLFIGGLNYTTKEGELLGHARVHPSPRFLLSAHHPSSFAPRAYILTVTPSGSHSLLTTEGIRAFFQRYGEVADAIVLRDASTSKSKGCGFVRFKARAGADAALRESNGYVLDGRQVGRANTADKSGRGRRADRARL